MAETDELGHTIRTEYDALGRVVVSRAPFEAGKERVIRNYYDAAGNQTEKHKLVYRKGSLAASENSSYSFDDWNRLREVITPEGRRVIYDYDGNNLRASKDVDGEITNFTHDGNNLILETDGRGIPRAKNFYGRGLVSRQTAADVCYYLFNGHGDVTQLLDQRGEIVKDYDYDPFGKERTDQPPLIPGQLPLSLWRAEAEQSDNPFRYAGEYLDQETGYYYLKARYYDPRIQRFISGDSLAKSPSWTEHSYAYVNYNPINCIDPSGHRALWQNRLQNTADWYRSAAASHREYLQSYNDRCWDRWYNHRNISRTSASPVVVAGVSGYSTGDTWINGVYVPGFSNITNTIQLASYKDTPEWASPLEKGDNDTIYPIPWYEDPIIAVITAPAKAAITIGRAAAKAVGTGISKGITKGAGKTVFKNIDDGLNFAATPAKHMENPGRFVPAQTLQDAIKSTKGVPDPRGSNAMMHYTTMTKNGQTYNLEVLYDKATNTVYHFEYTRKAIGNLPAIPK